MLCLEVMVTRKFKTKSRYLEKVGDVVHLAMQDNPTVVLGVVLGDLIHGKGLQVTARSQAAVQSSGGRGPERRGGGSGGGSGGGRRSAGRGCGLRGQLNSRVAREAAIHDAVEQAGQNSGQGHSMKQQSKGGGEREAGKKGKQEQQ